LPELPDLLPTSDHSSLQPIELIEDTERNRLAILSRGTGWEVVIAGSALLILLTAQWILASAIPGMSYYGLDGKLAQSALLTGFKFGGYFDLTNLSPITGIGAQLLPKNVWANPAYWPFALFEKETATEISGLIALACFASAVYVMMRCFDVAVVPSAMAAQSTMVLFGPTMIILLTPSNFLVTPGDAVVYAPYMVALGLLAKLRAESWRRFAFTAAGISALILYSIYCDPLWTMVVGFAWAVPFAVVTVGTLHPKTIMVRGTALGCCLAVLVLSGAATYLYTLSQYTARIQFAEVLDRVRGPELVSTMSYSPIMTNFYIAWALGWILGLVTLRGQARLLVLAASVSFVVWIGYSVVYLLLLNGKWVSPVPFYLEHALFALYTAGAVAGYWGLLRTAALLGVRFAGPIFFRRTAAAFRPPTPAPPGTQLAAAGRLSWRMQPVAMTLALLCVAIVPGKVANDGLAHAPALANARDPWADEPEVINFFSENIALAPGRPFRGAISFPPVDPFWSNTIVTLWSRSVPTVNEYSQLVSPEALYLAHKFTYTDVTKQLNRFDLLCCREPASWAVLQMIGVRYYVAPGPLGDRLNPGYPLITMPHRSVHSNQGTWYVYELPRPNVGDYNPTEIMAAGSAAEIIAILSRPDFDFTKQAVVSAPLDDPLVAARDMRLSIIRGGLHVSGKSEGTSLVILPQQFSHCLRARNDSVRLVRANLMMTGMIFSGDLDTDIVFDYGIFSPGCRRADLADVRQLDLKIDLRAPHLAGERLFPDWDDAMTRLRTATATIQYAPILASMRMMLARMNDWK
jgi:hypothetical protein